MTTNKPTFALFFGNRGFFPASLMASAREEIKNRLEEMGYGTLLLDAEATRFGAVETPEEGRIYRNFLDENRGKYDGVILSLPNFGDETGAVAALKDAGVPIYIQAYPDDLDKMAPDKRRDAFCGKFSVMDVFVQYGLDFSVYKPHTVHPKDREFERNIERFAAVCRVAGGLKAMTVGSVGARTTAFKTVRIDELALQKHGITMETYDMSSVFASVRKLGSSDNDVKKRLETLKKYADFGGVPEESIENLAKFSVVFDRLIDDNGLDAIAVRCWLEIQEEFGISPCVLLSEMNNRGLIGACEVDVGSAITMYALKLATGNAPTCLDWNNNYGDDPDKCILFHCGPVPASMMTGRGKVIDHEILKTSLGPGCSYGPNVGRIAPGEFTYGNLLTRDGDIHVYLGEARFTEDPVPEDFFGCAAVAEFPDLQASLLDIGRAGHRHHVACSYGNAADAMEEAFTRYLKYSVMRV